MNISVEDDILGGTSRPQSARASEDDLLGSNVGAPTVAAVPPPSAAVFAAATEAERIAAATRGGTLLECPPAYAEDLDWQTIRADDPFRVLYLDYGQYAAITDEQVAGNGDVLGQFWESRRKLLIRGGDRLKARFGEGTIEQAPARLEKAMRALADEGRRLAYFKKLEGQRLEAAAARTGAYLNRLLAATENVMKPRALQDVGEEGIRAGFTAPESENFLLSSLRRAGLKPVKRGPVSDNPLLETWTIDGIAPAGQAHIKVLRQDVYDLDQAAQVLYGAMVAGDARATEALDDVGYLENIAIEFKENDVQLALRTVFKDKRYNLPNQRPQRRIKVLYLLGPGLPFQVAGVPEFTSPAQLLHRTATSFQDFSAAEAAFTAGLLPIWIQAAATADVQAALPAKHTALDFRRFLHRAKPDFPLWIGSEKMADAAELAAYIRLDENTWKMVYGAFSAGNLVPWADALGQSPLLARQEELATAFLGPEPSAEIRPRVEVQALLEALDPATDVPRLEIGLANIDLTGLSGEALVQRSVTITNVMGGPVRAYITLEPKLEGVWFATRELFFDQRAPGQQLTITLKANAAAMPRDGQHKGSLKVRSVYQEVEVPVVAEAVFPLLAFAKFVGGAALALAVVFGAIRYFIGAAVGEATYQAMIDRGTFLPFANASQAGNGNGYIFLLGLLALVGLCYAFVRVMAKLSKYEYVA